MKKHCWSLCFVSCFVVVSACSHASDASARATPDSTSLTAAAAATPQSGGPVNSEIVLDVTGGPNAGHYTAKVTTGGCTGSSGSGSYWGNQYSIDTNDPRQFSSLQLVVDSAHAPGGSKRFMMTITFGPLTGGGASYDVSTRGQQHSGDGTIRVTDRGASATVDFDARTKEGVGLKGTIECHHITRFG